MEYDPSAELDGQERQMHEITPEITCIGYRRRGIARTALNRNK